MEERKGYSKAAAVLFGPTRRHVLAVLFGHPERQFYQHEIAAGAPTRLSAVQRELERLVDADLVKRTRSGRRVYYQANADHPLFPELRGIVLKTVGLVDVLREALEPLADRIDVAFVFGSMAAGEPRADSDVDLMVVGRVGLREVVEPLREAEGKIGREITPIVYTPAELAVRVTERQYFVCRVLEGPKIFIIGDESELTGFAAGEKIAAPSAQPPGDSRPGEGR